MLEFFIALFGGIYYGYKYFNEKNKAEECNERRQAYRIIDGKIKNWSFEYDLHPTTEEKARAMVELVSNELQEVFGDKWRNLYNAYRFNSRAFERACGNDGFGNLWNLAFEILLSKHGYVPYFRHDKYGIKFIIDGLDDGLREQCNLRACKIIEKNMQKKHPELNIRLWESDVELNRIAWEHYILSYDGTFTKRPW